MRTHPLPYIHYQPGLGRPAFSPPCPPLHLQWLAISANKAQLIALSHCIQQLWCECGIAEAPVAAWGSKGKLLKRPIDMNQECAAWKL